MSRPSPLRVHAGLFSVAALFSLNYIISKLAMRAFDPVSFSFLRVAGAAIILNLVLPRDPTPLSRDDQRSIVLFGILGVVLNQTLFLAGLSLTNAHIAAILITTIPVFTLAIAIGAGSERATRRKIAGIAIAAFGALLVIGGESIEGTWQSVAGAALIVGNSLSYAFYLVVSKPTMARLSARRVVSRMFFSATILMIPIAAVPLWRTQWRTIPAAAWTSLALVIAGPTVIAYLINAWTLRHADASMVGLYIYVQPFLTAILAAAFLHETIRASVVVAAALIFTGVFLSGRPAPPAAPEEAVPGSAD